MAYYFLVFIPAKEGGYAIFSPDFPELISMGQTLEECMRMGSEALAIVVEEFALERRDLPEPLDMDQARNFVAEEIKTKGFDAEREPFLQLFPAPSIDMTPVKISISLTRADLAVIDAKAKRMGMTRSKLLSGAARAYPEECLC